MKKYLLLGTALSLASLSLAGPHVFILNDNRYVSYNGRQPWTNTFRIIYRNITSNSCEFSEGCGILGTNKLLQFHATVVNDAPAIPPIGGVYNHTNDWIGPNVVDNPNLLFYDACHNHYHARYVSKFTLHNNLGQLIWASSKQGWCLTSTDRFGDSGYLSGVYWCQSLGLDPQFGDTYDYSLPCTWVNLTGLTNGTYLVGFELDPLYLYGIHDAVAQWITLDGDTFTLSDIPPSPPAPEQ